MSTVLRLGGFEPVAPGCRRAVVPSPWPPRAVAVFLLESDGEWLVDTGASTPESIDAVRSALDAVLGPRGVPRGVILSHSHLDHAGGVEALRPATVVAHRDAAAAFRADERTPAGIPFREVEGSADSLPDVAGWEWILGEGHAPGHLLLWQPESGTVLVGDQFLLGLKTPLRTADETEDSFGRYLATIDRVAAVEPRIMFSSHTEPIVEPLKWLARERRRLERRLERTRNAVQAGARTAAEVTAETYRSIPGAGARELLAREQLAALRHLVFQGEVQRQNLDEREVFEAL